MIARKNQACILLNGNFFISGEELLVYPLGKVSFQIYLLLLPDLYRSHCKGASNDFVIEKGNLILTPVFLKLRGKAVKC